jgi:N-acetyl-anhydromuramyl-L-alanine amidase AmpD
MMPASVLTITDSLLDRHNAAPAIGVTVGERLLQRGYAALWDARETTLVDTIVIHYISAADRDAPRLFDLEAILKIFCDDAVSAHFLVPRDGSILRLVPEIQRAWHAGSSIMPHPDNRTKVNDFSIGIELVATHTSGFTPQQMGSLVSLCRDLGQRYRRRFNFVGHSDIAGERCVNMGLRPAERVKIDPGPLFDWAWFTQQMS